MAKQAISFQQVSIDSLSGDQHEAFIAYLQAKEAFRASLQSLAPQGNRIVFTEKYGTASNPAQSVLKVALVQMASAKPDKGKVNLADWIAQRSADGRDC